MILGTVRWALHFIIRLDADLAGRCESWPSVRDEMPTDDGESKMLARFRALMARRAEAAAEREQQR